MAQSKGNRQVRLPFYGFPTGMVILAQKATFGTKLVAAGRGPAGTPALPQIRTHRQCATGMPYKTPPRPSAQLLLFLLARAYD